MSVNLNAALGNICRFVLLLAIVAGLFWGSGTLPFVYAETGGLDSTGQEVPRFERAACMFSLPTGLVEGQDVDCGYLIVPEQHADPAGPTIRLAVAILSSQSPNPEPDPLVLLQGGPGGSTIDTYMQAIPMNGRLRADRDIVMFDQRGTLYSQPGLDCPEFMDLMLETLDQDLTDEESARLSLEALSACRSRLVDEGIDLSAFDSVENAADVEALRQALGYEQINLYGVSYGSLLAQHVMRFSPEGLRSVILDAVVPPQVNFNLNAPHTMNRAFEEMFAACRDDLECNAAFPDLRGVFYQQVDRLNERPDRMELTDFETGNRYQSMMDGEVFMSGIFQMMYSTEIIPIIPRIIYDTRAGDYAFFTRIYSIFAFDRSLLYGMYYSVQCAEEANYSLEDYDLSGLPDQIRDMEDISAEYFLQACQLWDVEPVPPEVDEQVHSDIPTLVLSGRFDPITPPSYGDIVAEGLSNAYVYIFPSGGHGAAVSGECQDQVILDFLRDPLSPPNAACIETMDGPDFVTPSALVRLPVLAKLLNLEDGTGWQAALYIFALLFLLTALFIYPLAWIIRLFSRKPARPESGYAPVPGDPASSVIETESASRAGGWPRRLAPWLAALTAIVLLIFTIIFIVVIVNMVTANDLRILLGMPGRARPLFILPVLAVGLVVLMIGAAVAGWFRRSGSIAGRLYFSLLTIAALVCVAILAAWGMMTALILA